MLEKYLYKLLKKYLSFYLNENSYVVEITSGKNSLFKNRNNSLVLNKDDKDYSAINNPDFIILNGNLHYEKDIQQHLTELHKRIHSGTRLIILYYSNLWKPFIKLATFLSLRDNTPEENWITHEDAENLMTISGFEIVQTDSKIIFPLYIPLLSSFFNRFLAPLPIFRLFSVVNIAVARPLNINDEKLNTVSIIIPARNEEGTIEEIVKALPKLSNDDELIFIEGNSTDNTWNKITEVAEKYKNERKIIIGRQDGKGKGDAVRKGFSVATKDILIIYDADMTVPPQDLIKFYNAIKSNKGEFINGSRLVYPMEKESMRFFNMIGNKFFAICFSFIIGQKFKDTLCGTKVISRKNYNKLIENRSYFGDFDPFGDFDLIFGSAKSGLKIVEIPVKYKERVYGSTNIKRWKHGFLLLKMLLFAMKKIKFI
jgi:hypothetical protein